MVTNKERIEKLQEEVKKDNLEAKTLMDVACLYYPNLMQAPNTATPGMKRGYNRLVEANITDVTLKRELQLE